MEMLQNQIPSDKQGNNNNTHSYTSSPEFTFTISLNPTATKLPETKNKPSPLPSTVDLSPADEIFSHGQLLPLPLHPPITSPRSSTNSNHDNFTLPIKEISQKQTHNPHHHNHNHNHHHHNNHHATSHHDETKSRKKLPKSSTFTLMLFGSKHNKHPHEKDRDHHHHHHHDHHDKPKSKFEALKRCIKLVKPFLYSLSHPRVRNRDSIEQPCSFSGNLRVLSKKEHRGGKGGFSAPASMRNSPTNSGRLVPSGSLTPIINASTSSDSTIEELQSAVKSAIAHCKKSGNATHDDDHDHI